MQVKRKRILTGDRPTGRLHLGHYVGSLANRVRLQDEYDCFFIVADLHTLTTRPEKPALLAIGENVRQMVLDYLAAGLDPERSTIFLQSAVPETFELNLYFQMLVSVPRLERVPTLKEMASAAYLEAMPYGLLGYPVLQPQTSCCRAPIWCRLGRTTRPMSKSRARSPVASTTYVVRPSRSLTCCWVKYRRCWGSTARPR